MAVDMGLFVPEGKSNIHTFFFEVNYLQFRMKLDNSVFGISRIFYFQTYVHMIVIKIVLIHILVQYVPATLATNSRMIQTLNVKI